MTAAAPPSPSDPPPAGDMSRHELHLEQLTLVNSNYRRSVLVIPFLALFVAGLIGIWHPWPVVALWLAATWGLCAAARTINERFFAVERSVDDLATWSMLSGLVRAMPVSALALTSHLFWIPGDATNHMILMVIAAGGMSMASSAPAAYWPTFLGNFVPFAFCAIAAPLVEASPVYFALSALVAVYAAYVILMAVQTNALASRMLKLAHAKDDLVARLEQANHAKSSFLASMSHELRTPLNAIMGFSDMMRQEVLGPLGSPSYRGYAGDIHASGAHLLGLINDILDLSRIEAGRWPLARKPVAIAALAQDCIRLVKVQADAGGVVLTCDVTRDLTLHVDERAIRQVLLNLLSNAVKFTPKGGRVMVFGHPLLDGGAILGVSDTGSGIDRSEQAHVFEPFNQARQDVTLASKGTGLGLPIVKGLVEAHGARIALDSEPDVGTTVSAVFPPECLTQAEDGANEEAA